MQDEQFNNILKNRAKEFVLTPNSSAFENITAARKQAKRNRLMAYVAFFILGIGASIFILISNINDPFPPNNSTITLSAKSKKQIIANKKKQDELVNKAINKLAVKTKKNNFYAKQIEQKKDNPFDQPKQIAVRQKLTNIDIVAVKEEINDNNKIGKLVDFTINETKTEGSLPPIEQKIVAFDSTKISTEDIVAKVTEEIINVPIKDSTIADNIQNLTSSPNPKKVRKPIGFNLTLFNNYMLVNKAYNGANNDLIKNNFEIDYNDEAKQMYSIGLLIGFTRKNFTLKTGLAYNNVLFNDLFIKIGSFNSSIVNESSVNNDGYNINIIDQSLSFVEMPFLAAFNVGNKKLNWTFETGIAMQYLVQTNTYSLLLEQGEISYTQQNEAGNKRFKQLQMALQASILANYKLTNHVSIFIGPIAKFHVNQYYQEGFTQRSSPIYLGLNSGINFNFKR